MSYYAEKIERLESENARLKAECQARQAENSVLAVECDSLKAEVERSRDQYNGIIDTQLKVIDELKAEVERLRAKHESTQTELFVLMPNYSKLEMIAGQQDRQIKELEAQVERLTKAGDYLDRDVRLLSKDLLGKGAVTRHSQMEWNAAKEGKQP